MLFATAVANFYPPPKSTIRSHVVTITKEIKDKKRVKKKIVVVYVVNSKVGYMEDNTREVIIRRTSKEVVGCLKDVVFKKKLPVQF